MLADSRRSALRSALSKLDLRAWDELSTITAVFAVPVTDQQWAAAVRDSRFLERLEQIDNLLCGVAHWAVNDEPQAIGRQALARMAALLAATRELHEIGTDLLCFAPPTAQLRMAIKRPLDERVALAASYARTAQNGGSSYDRPTESIDQLARDIPRLVDQQDDPVLHVYGIRHSQVFTDQAQSSSSRLNLAFEKRPAALTSITRAVSSFAVRGEVFVEEPDPGRFPLRLAVDARPWIAHRAARAACDLVRSAAARSLAGAARVVADNVGRTQQLWSTHQGISFLRDSIAQATSKDIEVRHTAGLYAALTEGPLKQAAAVTLSLLGEPVGPVTLGEISGRLMAHRTESSLCQWMLDLLNPRWRNASAHEGVYWDPVSERAMFQGDAVDMDAMCEAIEQIRSFVANFQAGVAFARSTITGLAAEIDGLVGEASAFTADVSIGSAFQQAGLVATVVDRNTSTVRIRVQSVLGVDQLQRIGIGLVRSLAVDTRPELWIVHGDEGPAEFSVSRRAIEIAADLMVERQGSKFFLSPTCLGPLIADALVQLDIAKNEAASAAFALLVDDTLNAVTTAVKKDRPSHNAMRRLHEETSRTVRSISLTASHLSVDIPAEYNLSGLCQLLNRAARPGARGAVKSLRQTAARRRACRVSPVQTIPWL